MTKGASGGQSSKYNREDANDKSKWQCNIENGKILNDRSDVVAPKDVFFYNIV